MKDSWDDLKNTLSSIYKEFGASDSFSEDEPNLKNAYQKTEALWKKQYELIDRIRFVLIGEAPLFGDEESYFDNNESPKLTAFFRHQIQPEVKSVSSAEKSDLLKKLRKNGFIVLDLLPYALNDKTAISYQKKFRGNKYIELFEKTYDLYLKPKLELIKIKSDKNIKFSFRYKKHRVLTDKVRFRLGENGFSKSSIQGVWGLPIYQ